MSQRRAKIEANTENKHQLSREMRRNKHGLFIQQIEKEAQDRMRHLESKLESLLATVDKVFKVELMKMPPSLQNTLVGDLISQDPSASEVSIAIQSESREMAQPLKRVPRGPLKSTDSPPVLSSPVQRSSARNPKGGKTTGIKRNRTIATSNSAGNLRASLATVKRTQSHLASRKTAYQPEQKQKTPKLRSVLSAGELSGSVAGSAAYITVTTAEGQMLMFSEETKEKINLELLDDVAWCQIQKLTSLMEYLAQHSHIQ
ncbi:PREDICTED: borealin-2-like [Poecilia mexicana]|uniref:Borealin N-terminal domain-containing protein n=1 Tax=Poecilia mexicana TaxID=48701 RepID=A0A3B3YBN6_9TELE|nr:PREDICTED: borealin-2-like [Poecilia mexicana]